MTNDEIKRKLRLSKKDVNIDAVVADYMILGSLKKVADKHKIAYTTVKQILAYKYGSFTKAQKEKYCLKNRLYIETFKKRGVNGLVEMLGDRSQVYALLKRLVKHGCISEKMKREKMLSGLTKVIYIGYKQGKSLTAIAKEIHRSPIYVNVIVTKLIKRGLLERRYVIPPKKEAESKEGDKDKNKE